MVIEVGIDIRIGSGNGNGIGTDVRFAIGLEENSLTNILDKNDLPIKYLY